MAGKRDHGGLEPMGMRESHSHHAGSTWKVLLRGGRERKWAGSEERRREREKEGRRYMLPRGNRGSERGRAFLSKRTLHTVSTPGRSPRGRSEC